ncbi:MAG: hypothetical protein KDC98_13065 [Planctomycetes bacterium]|nr:hypothetical protein [Planctomycetota bacterium]
MTAGHVWDLFPEGEDRRSRYVEVELGAAGSHAGRELHSLEFCELARGTADGWLGDWVLLETATPCWGPESIACIHPSMARSDWSSPEGKEVYLAGYLDMLKDSPDSRAPRHANGPHVISGTVASGRGIWMNYHDGWPPPMGGSGGGMYVWNEDRSRVELVGIFLVYQRWPLGLGHWLSGVPIGMILNETVPAERG